MRPTVVQLRYAVLALLLAGCSSTATATPTDFQTSTGASPITVRLTGPRAARTGAVVTVPVHLASPSGQAYLHTVDWGDGTPTYVDPVVFSCPSQAGPPSPAPKPGPSTEDRVIQHIYRAGNPHPLTVTAVHGGCYPPIPQGTGSARMTIRVTGPRQPGNGPVTPTGDIGLKTVRKGLLTAYLDGRDQDGYARTVTVDWGDGTPAQTYATPSPAATPRRPGGRRHTRRTSLTPIDLAATRCAWRSPRPTARVRRRRPPASAVGCASRPAAGWTWTHRASCLPIPRPTRSPAATDL